MASRLVTAVLGCYPDELVQQALPCFNFWALDNINSYFIDSLELCHISAEAAAPSAGLSNPAHPWTRLPGCVPEVACRCVGAYLLKARHVEQGLSALKTQLTTDVPRLRNATTVAARWQPPLRPGKGGLTAAEARQKFWKKFDGFRFSVRTTGYMGVTLANSSEPDAEGIAQLGSELLGNFKLTKEQSTYQLQLQHGNSCALELFHGSCKHEHFRVFQAFAPVQGPAAEGMLMDFLGISSDIAIHCEETYLALWPPGRSFDCAWEKQRLPIPRGWPVLDEEYLEWADVLSSALDASLHQRPLRMADIGAGSYGLWASRAAKAFLQRAGPTVGCELLLVEPFVLGDQRRLREHLQRNFPEKRCQWRVETRQLTTSDELKALLAPGEPWDLLDIDAQGMELPFLQGICGWLRGRVRRLHVSTHERWIHWKILDWLKEEGWHVPVHFPTYSLDGFQSIGRGSFLNVDGHITAVPKTIAWA